MHADDGIQLYCLGPCKEGSEFSAAQTVMFKATVGGFATWQGGMMQDDELDEGCRRHVTAIVVVVAARGLRMLVGLAACSGSRRVAELCLGYSGVVHRRKTAQATSLACWHDNDGRVRGLSNKTKSTCSGSFAV
uniref:Uncharacterized protein n=1 Tax=Setaria viridis TaxID=4556 RepID=A0A4U6VS68_SETVI|nr:hypothetical protein SEVIR_2G148500v2 [Setaria viridis]